MWWVEEGSGKIGEQRCSLCWVEWIESVSMWRVLNQCTGARVEGKRVSLGSWYIEVCDTTGGLITSLTLPQLWNLCSVAGLSPAMASSPKFYPRPTLTGNHCDKRV